MTNARISPAIWLGLVLFAWLSYFQFPGHVLLESDTQIYLPMFERFRDPALFDRDPMVIRAHTAFTLYDELTLGLDRVTGLSLEAVLGVMHLAVRVSLLAGIFLLTRAMGLSEALALVSAGVYALGGRVLGPAVLLVEVEAVPRAFALGPVMLGLGLAAHSRYLAAGLAAAAGFLLHPTTAAPFWIVFAVLLFVRDEPEVMQARLWGLAPLALAVIVLKLASSAQPGVVEPQAFLGRIDGAWEQLIRQRASYVWVSQWPAMAFWQFALMLAVSAAAYWRLRRFIQPTLRVFLTGLTALGILSLPLSYLLLEKLKWAMLPQWQPLRSILFVQVITLLLALVMAFELACRERRPLPAVLWASLGIAAAIEARLLFVLAPAALAWLGPSSLRWLGLPAAAAVAVWGPLGLVFWKGALGGQLLLALALGALLAGSAMLSLRRPRAGVAALLATAAAAFFLVPGEARFHWSGERPNAELAELGRWARAETSADAVFLFADAGRSLEPGVFRARAARAVYVDWKGGGQINFFREYARLWWSRWQETLETPFRADRLPAFRALGIDYIVLSPSNRLADRRPAFENPRYLVYTP